MSCVPTRPPSSARANWWRRTTTRPSLNWPKGSWRPGPSDSCRCSPAVSSLYASFLPTGSPAVILEPKRVRDRADEVIEQVNEWKELSKVAEDHYAPLDESLAPADIARPHVELRRSGLRGPRHRDVDPVCRVSPSSSRNGWGTSSNDGYRGSRRGVARRDRTDGSRRASRGPGSVSSSLPKLPGPIDPPGGTIVVAELARGFVFPWAKLALVAESDLTGRRSSAARTTDPVEATRDVRPSRPRRRRSGRARGPRDRPLRRDGRPRAARRPSRVPDHRVREGRPALRPERSGRPRLQVHRRRGSRRSTGSAPASGRRRSRACGATLERSPASS